jgi:hypothetical protein
MGTCFYRTSFTNCGATFAPRFRPDDAIRIVGMMTKPVIVAVSFGLLVLAMLWAIQSAPPLFTSGHLMSAHPGQQSTSRMSEERQLRAEVDEFLAGFAPVAEDEDAGPRP